MIRWLTIFLDRTPDEPTADRAVALSYLAWALQDLGDREQALAVIRAGREVARQLGDPNVEAALTYSSGAIRGNASGGRDGVDDMERAVLLFDQIGDAESANFARGQFGEVLVELGRAAEGLVHLEAADRWATANNNVRLRAINGALGRAYLDLGDVDRALVAATGRWQFGHEHGDHLAAMIGGCGEAEVRAAAGDLAGAARVLASCARTLFESGTLHERQYVLPVAATVLVEHDPELAVWLAAFAVDQVERDGGRATPRNERVIFAIEARGREALRDTYDVTWRKGAAASADDVEERVLAALDALAAADS